MLKKSTLILLLFLISHYSWAQVSRITGKVTDKNKVPLIGASISADSRKTVLTDDQGRFEMLNVNAGTYSLKISYQGKSIVRVVKVSRVDVEVPDILFDPLNELQEVEVFGARAANPEKLETITRLPLLPKDQIQTISTISDKLIEKQGNLKVIDAVRNVPGVYMYSTYGGITESISSRGYRGIPIYKNGVRLSADVLGYGFVTDMETVEGIQVLKGTNAITMGASTDAGTPGGLINVVTKTPKFINAGQVSIRAGGFGQFRPTFDVQQVLDKSEKIAFRINGGYENSRNFHRIDNLGLERFFVNPSIAWRPDDKTTIYLEYDFLNDYRATDPGTVQGDPTNLTNQIVELPKNKFLGFMKDAAQVNTNSLALRFNRALTDNISIRAGYYRNFFNQYATKTSLRALRSNPSTNINVNNNTVFQRSIGQDINSIYKNSVLQLDLLGKDVPTGKIKHTFMVGMDYRITDVTELGAAVRSITIDTIDITKTVTNKLRSGIAASYGPFTATNRLVRSFGITLQDVIQVTDWARIYGGLRYNRYISAIPGTTGTGDYRNGFWNPLGGVMIKVNPHINVFGSYTTSTQTPYFFASNPLDQSGNELGNERNDQVEVGVKSEWFGDRLRFNLTAYKINNKNINMRAAVLNPTTGFVELQNYYIQGGNDERKGIEAEVTGRITSNLEIIAGYAYIDAQYKEHSTFVKNSAPNNTPKHTANFWANYSFTDRIFDGLQLGMGIYYLGKRPYSDWTQSNVQFHGIQPNVKPWYNKSYTVVNLQAGYAINEHWSARVFVNNLFDKVGYDAYRTSYIDRIESRNLSGQLTYKF